MKLESVDECLTVLATSGNALSVASLADKMSHSGVTVPANDVEAILDFCATTGWVVGELRQSDNTTLYEITEAGHSHIAAMTKTPRE